MPAIEDSLHRFKGLYRKSPPWFKATVGWTYARLPRRLRYGPELARAEAFLAESQGWSDERLRAWQWGEFRKTLEHAYAHVPYYRRTWREIGLHPADVRAPGDVEAIPLIDKDLVRAHRDEFVSEAHRGRLISTNTGGSTGEPLGLYWEMGRTRALERAFMWRQWRWAGFEYGERTAVLRGQTVAEGIHYDPIDRHLFLSGLQFGDAQAPGYLAALRRFRPASIQAYPASITVLAGYMKRRGEPPIDGLKVILCGSENLYPAQRALLEEVFRCRVYSWYGLGEVVCLAGGCDRSDLYHVWREYSYTELVDPAGKALAWTPGARGEIVGTTFINHAMPLVRYRTGDVAVVAAGACPCGRAYPLWERIEGRRQEYVVSAEGEMVPLTAFIFGQHYHAFEKIERMQLVQERRGAVRVRVVGTPEWTEHDEREMEAQMRAALRGHWEIAVERVDRIETTRAGKHRFMVQRLPLEGLWAGAQAGEGAE